jgi:putative transposase
MKKARFTESQIVAILKEADAGLPVGDVIRKHGISSASYYKWIQVRWSGCLRAEADQGARSPTGGVQADRGGPDAREQGDEGADHKKALTPARKREAVDYLVGEEKLPISRACGCVGLSRAAYYRKPTDRSVKDAPVVDVLNQIVAKHGRWGFGLCFSWMRSNGYLWNHKRVWRVYKDMRLNLPRRTKRRLPKLPKQPLIAPIEKNITWALDFMHDTLYYSKPFRTLNIIDESNREVLAIEIDTSLHAGRVIRTLEQLGKIYGLPQAIRLDNSPELRSATLVQ